MKKLLILVAALFAFASCGSVRLEKFDELPEFPDDKNAYVFELPDDVTDNIIFRNKSSGANFSMKLYAFVGNERWVLAGAGFLKGHGDRDTTNSFDEKFKTARYYAVVSEKPCDSKFEIYESRSDLNISVLD